ncbi:MAG: hypothetical protein DRN27_04165 [Thermoplasmata archaeon]|nr:MAG: hypothetical protein DRN27_04165 [Thermoplasmata archaeon]
MIHGYIFDVYPDYKNDVMVTWLKTKKGPVAIKQPYHPSFFVSAPNANLNILVQQLKQHPSVKHVEFTKEKTTLGSEKKKQVLKITPMNLSSFHDLTKQVDMWGRYHIYQLYNVDLRIPTRYLQDHNLFFNAYVSWDQHVFSLCDDQWAIDYCIPDFSSCTFSIQQKKQQHMSSVDDPILKITVDNIVFQKENECDTIISAFHFLKKKDPDIIYTKQGDSKIFPILCNRAKKHGILRGLHFGRDTHRFLKPLKQETSYMSYGRILHRPAFYMFHGRAHIDTAHSFFHTEGGMYGLVDLSRCSNIPFQLLSRLGPGTAISQIQVNNAMQQGYLIPFKKTQYEMWKTAAALLRSDRGGLIFESVVGLHENVIELDFASLYPNIMVKYNISPETLLCPCCSSSQRKVPQLGYHFCTKKTGLIPMVLKPILKRRFLFKARSKNTVYDMKRYAQLQKVWKWVLIVCFGYTGYRNARYGRIECHESITAYSRDILIEAANFVERAGYEVLHGIVDSLWIHPVEPVEKPVRLARLVSQKTGVRMELEGRYHWIVFLPSKETGVGALTRYYGLFDDGQLKMRGIELRQHSTPLFFKELQKDMLRVFQNATTAESFNTLIPSAIQVLFDAARRIYNQQVDPMNLIFTTRISRPLSSYKMNTFSTSALKQLKECNIHPKPGQSVQYIVKNHHAIRGMDRVCVKELLTENISFDKRFYIHYLAQCGETILLPFEYTKDRLENMILEKIDLEEINT